MKLKALRKWKLADGSLYVAVTPEQAKKFYPRWGGLDHTTRFFTYRRHGVKAPNIILTTSIWARYSMLKEWEKVQIA